MNEEHYESGSCMYAAKKVTLYLLDQGIGDFKIIEGWISFPNIIKSQIWSQHTWVELSNGKIIDITKNQFKKFGVDPEEIIYHPTRRKEYYPEDYLDICNVDKEIKRDKPYRKYDDRIINDYKSRYSRRNKNGILPVYSSIKNILRHVYSKPLLTYLFKEIYNNPNIAKGDRGELSGQQKNQIKLILNEYFNSILSNVDENIKPEIKRVIEQMNEVDINKTHLYMLQNYGLILDFLTRVNPIQAWVGGFIDCNEEYLYTIYTLEINGLNKPEEAKIDREEVQKLLARQFKLDNEKELIIPKFIDYSFLDFIEKSKEGIFSILNFGNQEFDPEDIQISHMINESERYKKSLLKNAIYLMDEDWIRNTSQRLSVFVRNLSEGDITDNFDFYNYIYDLKDSKESKDKLLSLFRDKDNYSKYEFIKWVFVNRPKSTEEVYIYDIYIWAYYNNQIENLHNINIHDIINKVLFWERKNLEVPPEKIEIYREGKFPTWSKNGYKIINLHTSQDLIEEGNNLNHCVGRNHQGEVSNGTEEIYSIRTLSNKPICTIQYDPKNNDLVQYKMFSNAEPDLPTYKLIKQWAEDNEIDYVNTIEKRIEIPEEIINFDTKRIVSYLLDNLISMDQNPEIYIELLNRNDLDSEKFFTLLDLQLINKDLCEKYGVIDKYNALIEDMLNKNFEVSIKCASRYYPLELRASMLFYGYIRPTHPRFEECYNSFKNYILDHSSKYLSDSTSDLINQGALNRNGNYARYYYDLLYSLLPNKKLSKHLLNKGVVTRLDNNIIINGENINLFEKSIENFDLKESSRSYENFLDSGSISRIDYGDKTGDKIVELLKNGGNSISELSPPVAYSILVNVKKDSVNYEELFWIYLRSNIGYSNLKDRVLELIPDKYSNLNYDEIIKIIINKAKEDLKLAKNIIERDNDNFSNASKKYIVLSYPDDELLNLMFNNLKIFDNKDICEILLTKNPSTQDSKIAYTNIAVERSFAIITSCDAPKIRSIINKCTPDHCYILFLESYGAYLTPQETTDYFIKYEFKDHNYINQFKIMCSIPNLKFEMNEKLFNVFVKYAKELYDSLNYYGRDTENYDNIIYLINMNNIIFPNKQIYDDFCHLITNTIEYSDRSGYSFESEYDRSSDLGYNKDRIKKNINFLYNIGNITAKSDDDNVVITLFIEFCENICDYFIANKQSRMDLGRDVEYHSLDDMVEDVLNQLEKINIHKNKEEYDQLFSGNYKFYGLSNCIERIVEKGLLQQVISEMKKNNNIDSLIGLLIIEESYEFLSNWKDVVYIEIKNCLVGNNENKLKINPINNNTNIYVKNALNSISLTEEEENIIELHHPDLLFSNHMSKVEIYGKIWELIMSGKIYLPEILYKRNSNIAKYCNDFIEYLQDNSNECQLLIEEYISKKFRASLAYPTEIDSLFRVLSYENNIYLLNGIFSNSSFNDVQLYSFLDHILENMIDMSQYRRYTIDNNIISILNKLDNEILDKLLNYSEGAYNSNSSIRLMILEIYKIRENKKLEEQQLPIQQNNEEIPLPQNQQDIPENQ